MNSKNRVNFNSSSGEPSVLSFADFGKQVFAPLSEGFILAGYERMRHAKFAMMAGSSSVYQDVFESCREPLSEWRKSQTNMFPDLEIKNIQVNTQRGSGKIIENIDQAVQCFAQVSDAFLFCGYCGGDRKIEVYAEDPLMADAVSLLQIIAVGTWLKNKEADQ
jgi:hypothetical protein